MEKKFKAIVKDKETKQPNIIELNAKNKTEAIMHIRANGYSVANHKVKEAGAFDWIMDNTNCEVWDWKEN